VFLVQDGHQAHTQIPDAVASGSAQGVIWSPADHSAVQLDDLVRADWLEGHTNAIDPQLYVAPLQDSNPKKLPDHGLFPVPLRARDLSARSIVTLVDRILEWQSGFPVTHLLSPTVSIASMADRSAEVAANLADASISAWAHRHDGRELLVSVAVAQSLLADPDSVDSLLDELTSYECAGFYLLLDLDPRLDPSELAVLTERALYIVYTLTQVQEYTVWIGYSGLKGYILRAAGADALTGGWWQKQNSWSTANWSAGGRGRAPRPRIYLDSLVGSLLIDTELELISRQNIDPSLYRDVLTGSGDLADAFLNGRDFDSDYPRPDMIAQLFSVLGELDRRLEGDVESDMRQVLDDIADAEVLYRRIRDTRIQVDAGGGQALLTVWQTAITGLGRRLNLNF
jgi:hypothetical protein